jgi:hypothetical protein
MVGGGKPNFKLTLTVGKNLRLIKIESFSVRLTEQAVGLVLLTTVYYKLFVLTI